MIGNISVELSLEERNKWKQLLIQVLKIFGVEIDSREDNEHLCI